MRRHANRRTTLVLFLFLGTQEHIESVCKKGKDIERKHHGEQER